MARANRGEERQLYGGGPRDEVSTVQRLAELAGRYGGSLLPDYRGPSPMAWAIRIGEQEAGFSFHRMDAELDTGPILAQGSFSLDDEHSWDELTPKLQALVAQLFPVMLDRVERGDPGDVQAGGRYFSFLEPGYAWIDWSRPTDEIERQVRAWRFASRSTEPHGALAEIDDEVLRVLRVSREPAAGRAMQTGDGRLWIVEAEAA